jgi:hypothetical protein
VRRGTIPDHRDRGGLNAAANALSVIVSVSMTTEPILVPRVRIRAIERAA